MSNVALGIMYLLISTITGSLGAVTLKQVMNKTKKVTVGALLSSWWFWIALVLYIVSAVTNIQLLKYLDYSIAYPMTVLTYVWTVVFSYFAFGEQITVRKVAAIAFIMVGIFFIAR